MSERDNDPTAGERACPDCGEKRAAHTVVSVCPTAPAEPDAGDVEALAKALLTRHPDGYTSPLQSDYARRLVAEMLLASDWLADVRREAEVKALREAADELVWVRPDRSPCDNPDACCGSEASCDAMHPSTKVVGEQWLRDRAARLEAEL